MLGSKRVSSEDVAMLCESASRGVPYLSLKRRGRGILAIAWTAQVPKVISCQHLSTSCRLLPCEFYKSLGEPQTTTRLTQHLKLMFSSERCCREGTFPVETSLPCGICISKPRAPNLGFLSEDPIRRCLPLRCPP